MDDAQAYIAYLQFRHWCNKLLLSEQLGYVCGPAGVAPLCSGWYIVRPVMNLLGMGVGASKCWIDAGDNTKTPPGYFWCAWFDGPQYSVTYHWDAAWKPTSCWQATKHSTNLSQFSCWNKTDVYPVLSSLYDELAAVGQINVEFIADKAIEVHLRASPDPDYDTLVPVWQDSNIVVADYMRLGYTYISSYDDADGFCLLLGLVF